MELEKGGTTYEPQLKRHARTLLRQFYTDGVIDDMLARDSLTYDDVVSYLEQARAGGQGSMLKTIFGGASSEVLLTQWLADESHDDEIVEKQALGRAAPLDRGPPRACPSRRHIACRCAGEDRSVRARQRVPGRPRGEPPASIVDDRVAANEGAACSRRAK